MRAYSAPASTENASVFPPYAQSGCFSLDKRLSVRPARATINPRMTGNNWRYTPSKKDTLDTPSHTASNP